MLYSNLKPEGYLVTGPTLHLHYVIRDGKVLGLLKIPQKRTKVPDADDIEVSEVS